jgi:hypothetical protein
MRNISFALTTKQIAQKSKTVTRRTRWLWLVEACARGERPLLQPVVKGMGIPKGGHVEKIGGPIRVLNARREQLCNLWCHPYGQQEVVKEGFPSMNGPLFVEFYREHNGGPVKQDVTRIEFEYV